MEAETVEAAIKSTASTFLVKTHIWNAAVAYVCGGGMVLHAGVNEVEYSILCSVHIFVKKF